MRSIAIVTDSNCGMSPAQARELGVHMYLRRNCSKISSL